MINQRSSGFLGSIPTVTKNLIIINIICWFAEIVFAKQEINLPGILGLHFFKSDDFNLYQFITYMFMHDPSGIGHVFFNMFAVFMFGPTLESLWGPKRFLIFYMVTGIGAGIVQQLAWAFDYRDLLLNSAMQVNTGAGIVSQSAFFNLLLPTVGASGAVFGILLAFGMLFPNVQLMLLFPPIPIKAKWFVIGYGAMELILGVANFSGDNVAHFAHLGGMLFGIFMILYWKKNDKSRGNFF
ncbi:MAG: rhomboid family intramembrane serine protease [Bacteroidales bacterium 45-6]|nr:MAG: rhomboid family intramembrane serine protease [Bacteroidales bacterium 45-6]